MGLKNRIEPPYVVFTGVLLIFTIYAFIMDSPREILDGLIRISFSQSHLVTDYIAVGGIGAMLINSVIAGLFALAVLIITRTPPTGASIMALWLTISFAGFGKNIFNMTPLFCGVWLCSKLKGDPFREYVIMSLLASTIAPIVSEISFWNGKFSSIENLLAGIGLGIFLGIIFPPLCAYVNRVHEGYMLYNMGFTGGVISVFVVAIAYSFGVEFQTALHWDSDHTFQMLILISIVSVYLMIIGIARTGWSELMYRMKSILAHAGKSPSDYFNEFGDAVYFSMGVMGIIFMSAVYLLGADINGATAGGIFTIIGFSCFGKHIKNTAPVFCGALLSSIVNMWDPTDPTNILAILFSTGLAPIAGTFGWHWGILAGFIHVTFVHHAGDLNYGLNLYNNGFAAGFVAMLFVPLITTLRHGRHHNK